MSVPVNLNGIHQITFGLGGTTSASLTSPGVVTVQNTPPLTVAFSITSGAAGTNVSLMGVAPRAGSVTQCAIVVTASDGATALTFKIKKNGTDVFSADPTIAAGTAAGTVVTVSTLTSSPLSVAQGDVFSMDITTGTSSWKFTAQLE